MSAEMTAEQLATEHERGRLAGSAAIAGGLIFAAGLVWAQTANRNRPNGQTPAQLHFVDSHGGALIGTAALQSIGLLLLAVAAIYLFRATKARNPRENTAVAVMSLYGPLVSALSGLVAAIVLAHLAGDFVARPEGAQTKQAAHDVYRAGGYVVVGGFGLSGALALVAWFVMGSYGAMRVGLLSRFMGIFGMALGPGFLFGIGQLVFPFWLIALGTLFLGVWPGRVPPAWEAGRAIPWPRADPAASAPRKPQLGGERNGEVEAVGPGVRQPDEETAGAGERLRKRKRRR